MLIPLTLPPPMRQFLADGLQLLIARLATLTEEFRAGLIAAIGRTVADGAENLMDRVFPQGRPSPIFDDPRDESRIDPDEPTAFRSYDRNQPEPDEGFDDSCHEWSSANESPSSNLMVRACVAAGLNALGVWLIRVGFVPTSAVIALFGGIMLLFRK